jgi:hypothetical protein
MVVRLSITVTNHKSLFSKCQVSSAALQAGDV